MAAGVGRAQPSLSSFAEDRKEKGEGGSSAGQITGPSHLHPCPSLLQWPQPLSKSHSYHEQTRESSSPVLALADLVMTLASVPSM